MLEKLAPQKVINRKLGYIVQVADRFTMEYIEEGRKANVEVDFGKTVGLFSDSLKFWQVNGENQQVSSSDKDKILARVKQALEYMGSHVEYC